MAAVVPAKRGPKGPSEVTPAVLALKENRRLSTTALTRLIETCTGVALSVDYVGRPAPPIQPRLVEASRDPPQLRQTSQGAPRPSGNTRGSSGRGKNPRGGLLL